MGFLKVDDILNADDMPTIDIDVPEWGGQVRIKLMTANERDTFETSIRSHDGSMNTKNMRAKLVAICLVNEKNKRLFSDSELLKIGQKSSVVVDRLFWECMRHNGMTEKDAKELEEKLKENPTVS